MLTEWILKLLRQYKKQVLGLGRISFNPHTNFCHLSHPGESFNLPPALSSSVEAQSRIHAPVAYIEGSPQREDPMATPGYRGRIGSIQTVTERKLTAGHSRRFRAQRKKKEQETTTHCAELEERLREKDREMKEQLREKDKEISMLRKELEKATEGNRQVVVELNSILRRLLRPKPL